MRPVSLSFSPAGFFFFSVVPFETLWTVKQIILFLTTQNHHTICRLVRSAPPTIVFPCGSHHEHSPSSCYHHHQGSIIRRNIGQWQALLLCLSTRSGSPGRATAPSTLSTTSSRDPAHVCQALLYDACRADYLIHEEKEFIAASTTAVTIYY